MKRKEFIEYIGIEKTHINKNLIKVIQCIAFKYGITTNCIMGGKEIRIPKMKQAKGFICKKCFDYFEVNISLNQINSLLRPQRGKFPYTTIIIIETIYNLLKEERWGSDWKKELQAYLENRVDKELKYEEFLLGNIPQLISNKRDNFMESEYSVIFECFLSSRNEFYEIFEDISMESHCDNNFPSTYFKKEHIPQLIYEYQEERVYLKAR